MGYYCKFKYKSGEINRVRNLVKIDTQGNNKIILQGSNLLMQPFEAKIVPYKIILEKDKIEYLKITPVEEEEK